MIWFPVSLLEVQVSGPEVSGVLARYREFLASSCKFSASLQEVSEVLGKLLQVGLPARSGSQGFVTSRREVTKPCDPEKWTAQVRTRAT